MEVTVHSDHPPSISAHQGSLRMRIRLWTIAAFVATLAVFTALDVASERRAMVRAESEEAKVLVDHLAEMPEFRDTGEVARQRLEPLRDAMAPAGADLDLIARPAPQLGGTEPSGADRIVLASRFIELRDGTFEIRYSVGPTRYGEAVHRSIFIHGAHALLALAILIGAIEWILRRHLVRPLRAISYQIHQMRRGGWSPNLPPTDRELEGLKHAVAGLGPVLETQVHQWIEAERRIAVADVLRSLWRSIGEPRRRVQAIAGDLQAQHLVAPEAARKLRGLLADMDRIVRALDLEEWDRLGAEARAATAPGAVESPDTSRGPSR